MEEAKDRNGLCTDDRRYMEKLIHDMFYPVHQEELHKLHLGIRSLAYEINTSLRNSSDVDNIQRCKYLLRRKLETIYPGIHLFGIPVKDGQILWHSIESHITKHIKAPMYDTWRKVRVLDRTSTRYRN